MDIPHGAWSEQEFMESGMVMKTASAKSRLPEQQERERSWRFCGTWREVRHALTSKVADSPGLPVLAWKQRVHLVRLDGSSGGHVASSRTLRWGEVKSWRRRGSVKTWIVLPLRVFQLCAYIRAFWSFIRCLCVCGGVVWAAHLMGYLSFGGPLIYFES